MKVTGWTDYESDLPKLPDELYHEAEKAVIDILRKKGYRFSGYDHQSYRYGAPIIDDRYKLPALAGNGEESWLRHPGQKSGGTIFCGHGLLLKEKRSCQTAAKKAFCEVIS